MAGQPPRSPSDKPKVLPVASQDINCPEVDIADGGASLRVGGPDNPSVRYQFNIGDTARECDPAGPGQAALKIGVAGEVVIGPAGAAGTFSAPLKITVSRVGDNSPVFSQTYRVEATTDGVTAGKFRIVTDPISLPMQTLQLADVYSITVGFEGGTAPRTGRTTRRRRGGGLGFSCRRSGPVHDARAHAAHKVTRGKDSMGLAASLRNFLTARFASRRASGAVGAS